MRSCSRPADGGAQGSGATSTPTASVPAPTSPSAPAGTLPAALAALVGRLTSGDPAQAADAVVQVANPGILAVRARSWAAFAAGAPITVRVSGRKAGPGTIELVDAGGQVLSRAPVTIVVEDGQARLATWPALP